MALAMSVTTSRKVSSGFFRNHLYVLLGLETLACLVVAASGGWSLALTVAAAVVSYVGAVGWLYEAPRVGKVSLGLVCGLSWAAALMQSDWAGAASPMVLVADLVVSSLVLGFAMISMLLGHWYLNAPQMELRPLRRLLVGLFAAGSTRIALCGVVFTATHTALGPIGQVTWWLIALRWLFGLVGLLVLAVMAWQTLKIPNTQSATGILYVAVIAVLTGELVARLLNGQYAFIL